MTTALLGSLFAYHIHVIYILFAYHDVWWFINQAAVGFKSQVKPPFKNFINAFLVCFIFFILLSFFFKA